MNRRQRRAASTQAAAAPPQDAASLLRAVFASAVQAHGARNLAEAERLYRQVLSLDPRHAEALHLLGLLATESGRFAEARDLLAQSLVVNPGNADVHREMGSALTGLGRTDEAVLAYRRAIELRPGHIAANNLGVLLQQKRDMPGALAAYRCAVAAKADCAEAHNNMATVLTTLGRFEEAIAACNRALAANPDFAEAYANLGNTFLEFGQTADARAAITRALAINPAYAYAWHTLSDLKTFTVGDPDIAQMQTLLAQAEAAGSNSADRIYLAFVLGKAWMDAGDPDRAFAFLQAGNRLKHDSLAYVVEDDVARLGALAQSFGAAVMARFAGVGHESDLPIFIVGMPRSGTTLVEQILASHPDVAGGGELPALQDTIGRWSGPGGDIWSDDKRFGPSIAAMGRDYVERVAGLAHGRRRVVDKAMSNFCFAGLIHLMLPNARIIHCRRDAVDTCFSCYSLHFSGHQPFTYDLRDLGIYYRAYEQMMAHWRSVLPPERFMAVDYERLVDDLEGEARRLVAFCGLPWDAACLRFYKTRRQVSTASAGQVRQPLYRSSIGRWRPYARHLGPLLAALEQPDSKQS